MTDAIQVLTTVSSADEARRIARELIERRLAGCVQIVGPIESIYRWQGKTETATEWQCVIKTLVSRYELLESTLRELHSYEVPEIIVTRIERGGADYLAWLAEQCKPS